MMDLLRRVRRTPDRLLHTLRRRRVLELLQGRARPQMVLVVCHGNICRSPMAAALLRRELNPLGITVRSAGFLGLNRPAPAEAIAAAERYGVNLAEHRSRVVTVELARTADLIVVMDLAQRRLVCERFGRVRSDVLVLGDLDPASVQTRAIRDPVNERQDVFDQVYARIARCVRELATILSHTSE
jgi:protein-tyrosine phosphatase